MQAALVSKLLLELGARGRRAYTGLHAVLRLRGEAREPGLPRLGLLPGCALLRVAHSDLRKILLIGGANPIVQAPPAEIALRHEIADGRPEQRGDRIGNRGAGRRNRQADQKSADGGGKRIA